MTDHISREEVLALETDLHFDGIEQLKYWRCRHIDPTAVEIIPAADVKPVVRGKWRNARPSSPMLDGGGPPYCSVCGEEAPLRSAKRNQWKLALREQNRWVREELRRLQKQIDELRWKNETKTATKVNTDV